VSKFNRLLRILTGLLILIVSTFEFIAQTAGIVIIVGPVTFGPVRKIEASGLGIKIFFEGPIWYAFLSVLIFLIIIGVSLLISGIIGRTLRQLFR